jgi:hypothetical protein
MYFHKLRQLQKSKKKYNIDDIDRVLAEVSSRSPTRFSPLAVARGLQIDEKEALELLLKCTDIGILSVNYEVECPECSASKIIAKDINNLPDPDKELIYICNACAENYLFDPKLIWITFGLKEKPYPK